VALNNAKDWLSKVVEGMDATVEALKVAEEATRTASSAPPPPP